MLSKGQYRIQIYLCRSLAAFGGCSPVSLTYLGGETAETCDPEILSSREIRNDDYSNRFLPLDVLVIRFEVDV
jgi:hypothetical protein